MAAEFGGECNRGGAVGRGGHDREVRAVSARRSREEGIVVVARGGAVLHALRLRLLDPLGVDVDSVDLAAVREQQLDGELANQSEPDHDDDFT